MGILESYSFDPLTTQIHWGVKKMFSNETSTSCSAIDWTEGEGWRTEESYEKFDTDAHGWGPRCRIDDEVCVNDDKLLGDERLRS